MTIYNFLSPCVIQTIIICCTIIIITTIGVSTYRIYRKQTTSLGGYIYNASILTLLAIVAFSSTFYRNRDVLDFVSLASALISIILAIITILYSFYSNNQSAGQIETLNNAAKSVEKATLSYSESAVNLQENIHKIISAVNRVEEKTDRIIGMTSSSSSITSLGPNNHFTNFNLQDYINKYVGLASPIGVTAMYACIRSRDTNRDWNLDLFSGKSNLFYCIGFLISTTSAGFITLTIDFDSGKVSVSDYEEGIKSPITSRINSPSFRSNSDLNDLRDKIDDYFDKTSESQ